MARAISSRAALTGSSGGYARTGAGADTAFDAIARADAGGRPRASRPAPAGAGSAVGVLRFVEQRQVGRRHEAREDRVLDEACAPIGGQLADAAAEGDDELIEEFLEGKELPGIAVLERD